MEKLSIIGNGFDLHHHMNTDYQKFREYVIEKYPDLLEVMDEYYDISDKSLLWSEFEKGLAEFNPTLLIEKFADGGFEPDFGSDEFRDRDWYSYQIEIERELKPLQEELQEAFTNWINSQNYPSSINDYKITLDTSAHFLNFNYTTTLEDIYSIPDKQILHIHGKADSSDRLIYGHAVNPEIWRKVVQPESKQPENLTDEGLQEWQEEQSNNYSYAYDAGIDEIVSFFNKVHKNTESIIEQNRTFFNNMKDLKEITIYGHSMEIVDNLYYEKICEQIDKAEVIWIVYYHTDDDKLICENTLKKLDIPDVLIEMKNW